MRHRVRLKPHGSKRMRNGGWLYISTKAAKHLGVKPGDHLEIIFGANHFIKFLIVVPAGEEDEYPEGVQGRGGVVRGRKDEAA